jgi:uncharacterized protein (DUF433 family)
MSMTATPYKHIFLDEQNRPIIEGARMKVTLLVEGHLAYGWSPAEMRFQYPYLTLSQIHSALAYYWDHKEELDQKMRESFEFAEEMRRNAEPWPLRERLKAEGRIQWP